MNNEDDPLADSWRHTVRSYAEVRSHVETCDARYLQLRALDARHCNKTQDFREIKALLVGRVTRSFRSNTILRNFMVLVDSSLI